jgi:MFS-type transporter involved in bile tolerance (Atg22 family)
MIAKDNKKIIWSWALYDFANSAFTTLVVTFIYGTYFTKSIAPDELTGTNWWSYSISICACSSGSNFSFYWRYKLMHLRLEKE